MAVALVPGILYILTLKRALEKCAPSSQTMSPGKLWLQFIPLFNIVWHFIIVNNMAKSLENEFRLRSIPEDSEPGKGIGMAMCILSVCGIIPVLGVFASLAAMVCWIMYWVKISGYSKMLDGVPRPALYQSASASGGAPPLPPS
jgi:hypothetical protein